MEIKDKQQVLENLVNGFYEQIFCEKCMNTFLTNVYDFSEDYVLLEKRSLGLEYFCNAIYEMGLTRFPEVIRIGILDEDDQVISNRPDAELFSTAETDYRYIYVMEKMEHLCEDEGKVFDECIKDLDWKDENERQKGLEKIAKTYDEGLRRDIELLFEYYKKHKEYILWDLHGDNLMRRLTDRKIVILDPYAMKV